MELDLECAVAGIYTSLRDQVSDSGVIDMRRSSGHNYKLLIIFRVIADLSIFRHPTLHLVVDSFFARHNLPEIVINHARLTQHSYRYKTFA